jgi:Bacterial cell division membrane protein
MAFRGDHRARAFWRGHGLQRFSNDGTEGERQSVLLRSETGCVGRDRVCVMLLAMQFNYQQLKSRRVVFGLLFLSTVTLLSVFAFSSSNGAHRWIKLPWFSVQPSELSKLALVIFLAYFLEKRAGEEGDLFRTFVPCGIVTCWLAGLIVLNQILAQR